MLFSVIYHNLFHNMIYIRTITYNIVSSNDAFPKALAVFDRKLVHYKGRFHASLSGLLLGRMLHSLIRKKMSIKPIILHIPKISGPFAPNIKTLRKNCNFSFINTDYVIAHSTSGQIGVSMHCVCVCKY